MARCSAIAIALCYATSILLLTVACSAPDLVRKPEMTPTDPAQQAAKARWDEANSLAEATQELVGGSWSSSDSAAERCGEEGARWGLTRLGPGTDPDERAAIASAVEALWTGAGHVPSSKALGGDAPGLELRFPQTGVQPDGFFVEFRTTQHGSTVAMQTACTGGDVDELNRERYGERHTNTPPDIPGAGSASPAGPTAGATS